MIVYLVRHAWAEDANAAKWPDDGQRPLTEDGRQRFSKAVKTLVDRGLAPQSIVTSPLVRCRQTAEILAKHTPGRPALIERKELAPGSDLDGLIEWTCKQAPRCEEVAWVGHAPDVNQMAASLIGDETAHVRFAKGAVAAIRFEGPPEIGGGELCWLATAKLLGC